MDRFSVWMVRGALIWLALGITFGSLMLVDGTVPGMWRRWFAPTHGHVLFVGWFLQFAIGIAYWLLPRHRSDRARLGYNEPTAIIAFITLNAGLLIRVVVEPVTRAGHSGLLTDMSLVLSALLHVIAVGIFVAQLWGRAIPRPPRRDQSRAASQGTGNSAE